MKLIKMMFWISLCCILFGCESEKKFSNKDFYNLKQGDTLELYYSINSCCYSCIENKDKLSHVDLLGSKVVTTSPTTCDGCNHVEAFIFKAVTKGVDTIYLIRPMATQPCDSSNQVEMYIVDVQ
jgi:hypothetical protein